MSIKAKIYKLIDIRNNNILYVGCTEQSLSQRFNDHKGMMKRYKKKYNNNKQSKLYDKLNEIICLILSLQQCLY